MWPSKPTRNGWPLSRTLSPARSPSSAAERSLRFRLRSIGSSRHTNRPVATKLLAIAGQASDISTLERRSKSPRASSRISIVPSAMRISENDISVSAGLAVGLSARVSASATPDQFEPASGAKRTEIFGRSSQRSAASMRPNSSGSSRSRAVTRSAASARPPLPSSPRLTSAKLTVPQGNRETEASPRIIGSKPVTARISALIALRTSSAGMTSEIATSAATPAATSAARRIPRRLKPPATNTGVQPTMIRPPPTGRQRVGHS